MSKPEILAYRCEFSGGVIHANDMLDRWFDNPDYSALIRLTDHEAAIAELREDRDSFQRGGIQAREDRNKLLVLLQDSREDLSAWMGSYAAGDEETTTLIERIDAALAKHPQAAP